METGYSVSKIYLRETHYENPMELEVDEMEFNDGLFVFHCSDGEIVIVPVANIKMIEQTTFDVEEEE